MGEIWQRHPVHTDYEISDTGLVRCTRPRGVGKHAVRDCEVPWGVAQSKVRTGHLRVSIGGRAALVHRLVLETFVGPCPEGMECCHNNGVPSDNRSRPLAQVRVGVAPMTGIGLRNEWFRNWSLGWRC